MHLSFNQNKVYRHLVQMYKQIAITNVCVSLHFRCYYDIPKPTPNSVITFSTPIIITDDVNMRYKIQLHFVIFKTFTRVIFQ